MRRLFGWDTLFIAAGFFILVCGALLLGFLLSRGQEPTLKVRGHTFKTEIVSSPEDKARGLSGREFLSQDNSMVFTFDNTERRCFWMKDMKFSIDMVWLDESRKVTAIERDVSPSTFPQDFCHEGKSVVEFASGTTNRIALYIGDRIDY